MVYLTGKQLTLLLLINEGNLVAATKYDHSEWCRLKELGYVNHYREVTPAGQGRVNQALGAAVAPVQ